MDAVLSELRAPCRPFDVVLHDVGGERRSVRLAQHAWRSEVTMVAQRGCQANSERNVAKSATFRHRDVTLPVGALDAELAFLQIDVLPLEGQIPSTTFI